MTNHDSPIAIQKGGNLAKAIVAERDGHWSLPDGAILSSGLRRVASFSVDVVIVTTLLMVLTRSMIRNAWNVTMWTSSEFHHSLAYALVLLASHWLYWRVTGVIFSRSLGQRMFGIAIVCEDGSGVTSKMWDLRAIGKLIYLIPVVNICIGAYELARISQRHTHQSNLDLKVGTIVAHTSSLPPASRRNIK
ncbi:MAG TPA: RDD family protein [Candidatus Thalassarchaeaceae archaeon]|nr:RDD family protein [Candidatus Thalassarchaeaceae archaeon]|tara:strand:+ start:415 stop:987 length:573 start_codon:yes stop_codon:yes gene_type:complete